MLDIRTGWRFRRDPADLGQADRWFSNEASDTDWSTISIDSFWEQYIGFGWYRVQINVPAQVEGKDLFLAFGGVDEQAWVWCNGQLAGEHTTKSTDMDPGQLWRTRFLIPLTKSIQPGQTNTIVVRVLNEGLAGGIYLPVRLIARK